MYEIVDDFCSSGNVEPVVEGNNFIVNLRRTYDISSFVVHYSLVQSFYQRRHRGFHQVDELGRQYLGNPTNPRRYDL